VGELQTRGELFLCLVDYLFHCRILSTTKEEIVGIIVIDVKGLMMSLMSYYNISKIDLYIGLHVY
jgi:hypothetical protein